MTDQLPQKEQLPDVTLLVDQVSRHKGWSPIFRRALEELFSNNAFVAALNAVLAQSDNMLKQVGMTDLTQEQNIKNALRAQGKAEGLTAAVELICELASTPENGEPNADQ